jgi:hypothetical protein
LNITDALALKEISKPAIPHVIPQKIYSNEK